MATKTEDNKLFEEDVLRLLASQAHIGAKDINFSMKRYVTAKTSRWTHIFNLKMTL
jgi:hypothetical protein